MKSSIALAALVVASLGLGAIAPTLAANTSSSTTPTATAAPAKPDTNRPMRHRMGESPGPAFGRTEMFLSVVCSDKGAAFLDKAFTRTAMRLDLTADQTKLFDALKTTALTTQTNFSDTCATARPAASADAEPDLLVQMKTRLTIEQARVTALTAVLPDFETFYASLTDDQKAKLMPPDRADMGGMGMGMGKGGKGMGMGGMGRMDRPGRAPDPGRG